MLNCLSQLSQFFLPTNEDKWHDVYLFLQFVFCCYLDSQIKLEPIPNKQNLKRVKTNVMWSILGVLINNKQFSTKLTVCVLWKYPAEPLEGVVHFSASEVVQCDHVEVQWLQYMSESNHVVAGRSQALKLFIYIVLVADEQSHFGTSWGQSK